MHTQTLVLLPAKTSQIREAVRQLLARHRLDEEHPERPWRLDYWTVGSERIADPVSAAACGVESEPDLATNVCLVSRLPAAFVPGAIVTPDGAWHDLSDFGWKATAGESPANRRAWDAWSRHVRELLGAHADAIAVEVDAHS